MSEQDWLDVPRDYNTDERLRAVLLSAYQQGDDPLHPNHHLRDCPGTTITRFDGRRGDYGNVRFNVALSCPHESDEWVYEVARVLVRRDGVDPRST